MTFLSEPQSAPIEPSPDSDEEQENVKALAKEPAWILENDDSWGDHFSLPEWQDNHDGDEHYGHRVKNGWKGRDYLHCKSAPVRIVDYFIKYGEGLEEEGGRKGGIGTILTGIVHFTERAESHQGLCHGGSMCSVMDDIIGWCAMFVTGTCHPWSGFTVQVNTSLRRPIPVGKFLLARATITKVERRKVFIEAVLMDPENGNDIVHAEGDGLVVMNKGILPNH